MSDQRRALVLIVNFRSSAHLDRCLDSLQGEHVAAIERVAEGDESEGIEATPIEPIEGEDTIPNESMEGGDEALDEDDDGDDDAGDEN